MHLTIMELNEIPCIPLETAIASKKQLIFSRRPQRRLERAGPELPRVPGRGVRRLGLNSLHVLFNGGRLSQRFAGGGRVIWLVGWTELPR